MKYRNIMGLVAVVATVFLSACGQNYSEGTRVGTVTKLSRKGVMWKSWEGEMLVGGMRQESNYDSKGKYSGTSSVPNTFEFNVDPSCVEKIKIAQASGKRVELRYREWLMKPPSISNSHVIIEVIDAE